MEAPSGQITAAFPCPTYFYLVSFGEAPIAFSGVSGLEIKSGSSLFEDGTGGWYQIPYQEETIHVTLKRGFILRQSQLYDWIHSASRNCIDKKDISISLTKDLQSEPLVTWNLINTSPTKFIAGSFDACSNVLATEELSLIAERTTVHYH